MGVVQLGVTAAMPASPLDPKPARGPADREVGVEHHPVDAVVVALQQIPVPSRELVFHSVTVGLELAASLSELVRRTPRSRACLGIGVGIFHPEYGPRPVAADAELS